MAKGTLKPRFRYVIYAINGALPDTVQLAVGYNPIAPNADGDGEPIGPSSAAGALSYFKDIHSYSAALTEMVSQLNAFQRLQDCRAELYGMVFGKPATTPTRGLTADEQAEQKLVSLDNVERGWKKAISLANRDATVDGGVLDDQLPEDD